MLALCHRGPHPEIETDIISLKIYSKEKQVLCNCKQNQGKKDKTVLVDIGPVPVSCSCGVRRRVRPLSRSGALFLSDCHYKWSLQN